MLNAASPGQAFLDDVLAGLSKPAKEIPCKYLYDRKGSVLFDLICGTRDYYPTRCEVSILKRHLPEIGACAGRHAAVIEYGAGSGLKTRLLLRALEEPESFVPVDISRECLAETAKSLKQEFPEVPVIPICGDFTKPLELPLPGTEGGRRVVFFPGSTIGNFPPSEARDFLADTARLCGPQGGLIVGVDLKKDTRTLEAAYNDSEGVTARFDLNLLERINRELDGTFDLGGFRHEARYNEAESCIEMRLISLRDQSVRIQGAEFLIPEGEAILTERSYKYSPEEFEALASESGFRRAAFWTDPRGFFSVQYFAAA